MVEQLRRNLETGRNGEDVHSPHVGVVRNLDRPVIVVRRILLKALDTSHAHPSLVSVIGFPSVLARPGNAATEVKFLVTEHLLHLVDVSCTIKVNDLRLPRPLHVDLVLGEVSARAALIEAHSLMHSAIPPLTEKDLRQYASSG